MDTHRILVTGAAGFIGLKLSESLSCQGFSVTTLDRIPLTTEVALARHIIADICDRAELMKALHGDFDLVFHLASNTENRPGHAPGVPDFDVTVGGTVALLHALTAKPPKVVLLASTQLVYGGSAGRASEDAVLRPQTPFAAGKAAAEAFLSSFGHQTGTRTVACRLANIVGPGLRRGVVHDLCHRARNSDRLRVLGDGGQRRSYVHVDDCVTALLAAANTVNSEFESFNVSNVDTMTVAEIAKTITRLAGREMLPIEYTHQTAWQGDAEALHPSPDKLLAAGWSPKFSSSEAVAAAAQSVLSNAIRQ